MFISRRPAAQSARPGNADTNKKSQSTDKFKTRTLWQMSTSAKTFENLALLRVHLLKLRDLYLLGLCTKLKTKHK